MRVIATEVREGQGVQTNNNHLEKLNRKENRDKITVTEYLGKKGAKRIKVIARYRMGIEMRV